MARICGTIRRQRDYRYSPTEHQGRYDDLLGGLAASGQNEVSLTDPDCRKMKGAHGEHFLGYNVPVAVDAQHGLIAVDDVEPAANDRQPLAPLATAAKAELPVETLAATADQGASKPTRDRSLTWPAI